MALVTNGRVLFNSIPDGYPEPGKTLVHDASETIDLDNFPIEGGVLVKVLEVSVDPYLRERLCDANVKSFIPAFVLGNPIENYSVGVILRSENSAFKIGDHVYAMLPFAEYVVVGTKNTDELRVLDNKYNLPWSLYVGAVGMPGKTAYMAWKEYSHAKKGETVFVTTGAGPVGSLVIQFAKQEGLKVISSAGSDDKVQFMKECGADVAFNYKTTTTKDILEKEGPIDIYWDNVGGETLDLALEYANSRARFIECGMITGYNFGFLAVKNIYQVIAKSLSMNGFIVDMFYDKYEEKFYDEVPRLIAEGKLKYREQVWNGLDQVEEALVAVQKGTNKAKAVVHVADA